VSIFSAYLPDRLPAGAFTCVSSNRGRGYHGVALLYGERIIDHQCSDRPQPREELDEEDETNN